MDRSNVWVTFFKFSRWPNSWRVSGEGGGSVNSDIKCLKVITRKAGNCKALQLEATTVVAGLYEARDTSAFKFQTSAKSLDSVIAISAHVAYGYFDIVTSKATRTQPRASLGCLNPRRSNIKVLLHKLGGIIDTAVKYTSSSAVADRPRCRVDWLWPKVEDWNWQTIF